MSQVQNQLISVIICWIFLMKNIDIINVTSFQFTMQRHFDKARVDEKSPAFVSVK